MVINISAVPGCPKGRCPNGAHTELNQLHWLTMSYRLQFKLCCLTPNIRCDRSNVQSFSARSLGYHLRFADNSSYIMTHICSKFLKHAVLHFSPAAWTLTEVLYTTGGTSIFKCELFFCTFFLYVVVTLQQVLDSIARTMYVDAVYCYRPSSVVCQSVTLVSPAKTAGPIEMPFGLRTHVGLQNHMLDGDPDPHGEIQIPHGKGQF